MKISMTKFGYLLRVGMYLLLITNLIFIAGKVDILKIFIIIP